MDRALSLAGTRAVLGVRLERCFFRPPAYAAYALLLSPFAWGFLRSGDGRDVLLVAALLVFLLHILRRFIVEECGDGASRPLGSAQGPELLSFALVRALRGHALVTAGDLLEAAVATERGQAMLRDVGLDGAHLLEGCRVNAEETVALLPFLEVAARLLPDIKERVIDAPLVLFLLFRHVPSCQRFLTEAELAAEDLPDILQRQAFRERFRTGSAVIDPEAIRRIGVIGRSWAMGYTGALDWLTEEVSPEPVTSGEGSIVIHRESIEAVLAVLARATLRNVLVLGKVGVGKRALVRNVARALRDHERRVHLPFTRVLLLKTQLLLSGTQHPDAFLLEAFTRAEHSGRFLLIIEDLPVLLTSAGPALQAVLLKFLQARTIAIVALADTLDYHTLVKTNSTLDSLFEKVTVEDASDEETLKVLLAHVFSRVESQRVTVTYKATKAILELTKRYLGARGGLPGKALDVLDDAVLRVRQSGERTVREEHVREVISVRSRVNVQKVTEGERDRLLNLEEVMRRRVIGQEAAVQAVVRSLKRARIDIHERKRPIGTFLFLGPTGVGKTQTAKVLAEEYFGAADALIRLDMNEFSHEDSLLHIVAAANGNGAAEGFLTQRVQDNPFTLILLDEVEKAHPKVLNVFLQILDEGVFNDARGVVTDFRNCIIIATSNAGALFIREYVQQHPSQNPQEFKAALLETILREKIFSPEFVNRFDDVVLFLPLKPESARKIGSLMLEDIVGDVQRRRGIRVDIEADLVDQLVERGSSVEFGAREMRRTITGMIEDYLADKLLRNNVQRGETIVIRKDDVQW